MKDIWIAVRLTAVMVLLTGLAYPLVVTGIAKIVFPYQAGGSLTAHGSELIGQLFTSPRYFHGRPSAAGIDGYDGLASGGSNLGPTNKRLIDRVRDHVKKVRAGNPAYTGEIPLDLVTASGSGLDPDISPAAAEVQVARVAAARGISVEAVRRVVSRVAQGRQFGVLGEPRVNVLKLNLALDTK
jgi:potassium-transporting ATPase KdpC subunit